MRRNIGVMALAFGVVLAGPLVAQSKAVEFGLDAGFAAQLTDPKYSTIELPLQRFRIGFMVSDRFEIEPSFGVNWLKFSDLDDALTTINAELGALVHFTTDATKARPYLRPYLGVSHAAAGGESQTQFVAGAGLGIKIPIQSVSKFAFRLEAGYGHGFEKASDDIGASDNIQLLFGFSFLTK